MKKKSFKEDELILCTENVIPLLDPQLGDVVKLRSGSPSFSVTKVEIDDHGHKMVTAEGGGQTFGPIDTVCLTLIRPTSLN